MDLKIQVVLIAALGGLIGGGVTSFVTHFFSLEADRQEVLQTARRNAYVEWLRIRQISTKADLLREGDPEEAGRLDREFDVEGMNSLSRIGIYGDADVVDAVAEWLRTFSEIEPCDSLRWKQDIAVYQSMRASLIRDDFSIDNDDLSLVIFGCSEPEDR